MKTKNYLLSGLLGIALAGVIVTGCKKDPSPSTTNTDTSAATDEANASSVVNDSKSVSDASVQGNSSQYGPSHSIQALYSSNCNLRKDSTTATDTLTVTFGDGTNPIQCNDQRWRQGSIVATWHKSSGHTFSQAYFDSTNVVTLTFKNYGVGSSQSNVVVVNGTNTLTNTGRNLFGGENWSFSSTINLKYSNGNTASWHAACRDSLISSGGNYYYALSGTAGGTSTSGVAYSVATSSPVCTTALPFWNGGCKYIESGIVSITVPQGTISINFGTLGSCSGTATASLDGINYPISLL